jgi:hypothetical protein
MRNKAGFMILTLLLLTVPVLANAWNLTVKVAGGDTTNYMTASYGTTAKDMQSGTFSLYPQTAVTLATHGTPPTSISLNGGASTTAAAFVSPTSGNNTLVIKYAAAVVDTGASLTLAQNLDGGQLYAQNRNNTWSTTGVTGLADKSSVPVYVVADGNHVISSYKIGTAAAVTAGFSGAIGESFQVTGATATTLGNTVTATFALAHKTTATLFAPTSLTIGQVVSATITATSNDALATSNPYSFKLDNGTFQDQATASYDLSTLAVGPHTLTGQVNTVKTGSFQTPALTFTVLASTATANQGCNSCHSTQPKMAQHPLTIADDCIACHSPTPHSPGASCVGCHSITLQTGLSGKVNDNTGVRAITTEFAKWSHHVTGVTLDDAHCVACHLEGNVVTDGNGTSTVEVDTTKHLADANIYLRNADTDTPFVWTPSAAAPDHTGMDTFCMSCHDANGATSTGSQKIQAYINAKGINAPGKLASALNPFGDTISNRYDKMQRPAVTNVDDQFDTTNNSHHAVKGKRYNTRSRVVNVNDPRAMTDAQVATFKSNSSAALYGKRSTIYDAGNFNALYTPLGAAYAKPATVATSLGDDSTLHCGDCHTVGQWKAGVATNAAGDLNTVAIGAHGSNNEYMLRNTLGTDERHTQNAYVTTAGVTTYNNPNGAFLVCYNCHAYTKYGSIFGATGAGTATSGSHAGEYAQAGRCNGPGNTLSFAGYTTGAATDGTQFESRIEGLGAKLTGEQKAEFSNAFGIQCANCHNSGTGNAYGGIHGSANNQNTPTQNVDPSVKGGAYIDGMGNTAKIERFLPGLGNAMYVSGTIGTITGGTSITVGANTFKTGGISLDTNWEQKVGSQVGSVGAGCYTLGTGGAANVLTGPSVTGANGPAVELIDNWGGCEDHKAVQGGGTSMYKRIVRPVTY